MLGVRNWGELETWDEGCAVSAVAHKVDAAPAVIASVNSDRTVA